MRSHYDEFAVSNETNKMNSGSSSTSNNHYNHNNNNNNNSYNYSSYAEIPYHARENSLPFSYGKISKTSTPLRPTAATKTTSSSATSSSSVSRSYKNGVEHDLDFDFDFGLSSGRNGGGLGYGKTITTNKSNGVNGSGKDVSFNMTQTTNSTNSVVDRANKRNQFFGNGSGSSENSHNWNERSGGSGGCTQTLRYRTTSASAAPDEIDASMIKAQPRLTSPLLVRKTLGNSNNNNSRSPTRSNTNTIANTYHYRYGSSGDIGIGDSFDKFGVHGNINNNDSSNYGQPKTATYGVGVGVGDTLTKTTARHDFDELLRDRREKVYNEYRSTTHETIASPKPSSPLPPPRRFANGTVQLPSTLPATLKHNGNGTTLQQQQPPQVPQRNHSQNSKYNYDFQFNLNLDDHENDLLRRRHQTLDRSPQRQTASYQQYQQQQQQLYQTRDIPLASTYNVERNYHTISSSSSASHAKNNNNNYFNNNGRETLSPTSMLDIYSTPYDERSRRDNQLQSLEATTTATNSATSTLRTKRSDYSATYGNDNILIQHEQQQQQQHANIGQSPVMTDRESSPIYATSTKKVTHNNTTSAYRSNASLAAQQQASPLTAATSTSTLTVTDYPSPSPTIRPETPAFPVTPRTPFAAGSSYNLASNGYNTTSIRSNGYLSQQQHYHLQQQQHIQQQQQHLQQQQQQQNASAEVQNYSTETIYGTNYRPRLNSSLSMANSEPQEVAAHLVKFAKDSSKFWYKPNLSREEAISLLLNAPPGTFVVRDSTTYKNAYGLVVRVSQAPPGSAATGKQDELVRHFLIEPTTRGVRLKGCANEPVFTSLSALVYEHSINQLALPCLLQIPNHDIVPPLVEPTPAQKQLLTQGAACNVLWLFSCDTESLTGEEAIRKAIRQLYAQATAPVPTEVHFKVSQQGITLTDNSRKKFFRKHYTSDIISYCAIDPDHRLWTMQEHGNDNTTIVGALKKTIFAFVARRSASSKDNQCHVFCDLAINQPASAIVSFVNKTLPTEKQRNYVL